MFLAVAVLTAAVGLTGSGKRIDILHSAESLAPATLKKHVLLIGGLDGSEASSRFVKQQFEKFQTSDRIAISAIPMANPEKASLQFPPSGDAYAKLTESHYLWRFIGTNAPDLVIVAGDDSAGLAKALSRVAAAGIGVIPAQVIELKASSLKDALSPTITTSPARVQLQWRVDRTPSAIAKMLATVYGHELKEAVYIPALALIGRLRLGGVDVMEDVESIVAPYISGERNSMDNATSSHLSGHLIFAELAERTKNKRYVELVRAAADSGFEWDGSPRQAMPYHNEMSDSVFMGTPILVKAGKLTSEPRYFQMAAKHLRFMRKLCLRPDGLYRHSPLNEAAWGRGNGFPALGLALSLEDMPKGPDQAEMLEAFRSHMAALLKHQDETGMWRQVVDVPGSYREFSATAMIGFSMAKGIRLGWLDAATYRPAVERAWTAVKTRISNTGQLIDVCTNTGKQKTLKDYFERTAVMGVDARGGAMALLFATELMQPSAGRW